MQPVEVGADVGKNAPVAIAAVGVAMAAYAGYGSGALLRIGALDHPVRLVAGCLALAALWVAGQKKPLAVTFVLLAILPLFGNHPGGRYMEFVNLPVAASAAGLIAAARREQRPAPDGPIWRLAGLYLLTAIVAMIPTLPRLIVRAAQINDPMLFVAEALTAPEDNAMYSISSLVLVTLAVVWGFALSWGAGTAHRFTENAYRVLTLTLFGVVAIGISDYAGLTALGPAYLRAIDARFVHLVGLQSIFWQPGWFAWYFVIVFAIALGLWTIEVPRRRLWLGSGILLCYLLFFLNPQRGGLIAVHVVLSLFAWYSIRRTAEPRRSYQRLVAVGLPVLVLVAGLLSVPASRAAVARGNLLSIERSINNTLEFLQPHGDANRNASERLRLWRAAMVMWRDAPAFGIGEGSFAWRFHEYIPAGSALDTPSLLGCSQHLASAVGDARDRRRSCLYASRVCGCQGALGPLASSGDRARCHRADPGLSGLRDLFFRQRAVLPPADSIALLVPCRDRRRASIHSGPNIWLVQVDSGRRVPGLRGRSTRDNPTAVGRSAGDAGAATARLSSN